MKKKQARKPQIDFKRLSKMHIAALAGVTIRTIDNWRNDVPACPVNTDGTYSSPDVFGWRLNKAEQATKRTENDLDREKTLQQIESLRRDVSLKDQKIKTLREQSIDIGIHEQIMVSRARSLNGFLTESMQSNAYHFANKSIEEVQVMFTKLKEEMMSAYLEGAK